MDQPWLAAGWVNWGAAGWGLRARYGARPKNGPTIKENANFEI